MVRVASLFSQILGLFSRVDFQRTVERFKGDRHCKGFTCWDQFVAMLFCQLAKAQSLREISGGLRCCIGKLRHLGVNVAPTKSSLSRANKTKPWEMYREVFEQLLEKCRAVAPGKRRFRFKNKLYSLDSTTVELSLSLFDWAKFQQKKGAVKLHMILDHDGHLPSFAYISDGKTHDVTVAQTLSFPAETVVVMDRGYLDYQLYSRWTERRVWFVTRARKNMIYRVQESREVKGKGVLRDEIIRLSSDRGESRCPCLLRLITYRDPETGNVFEFLTNHMGFAASTIAAVYKDRWQIESFFKTLKQNLKIKTFVGTSANAVHVQIWTALIAILLVKYLQFLSRRDWSISNLVTLLNWNLFTYRDLRQWLDDPFQTPPAEPEVIQLEFSLPGLGQHQTNSRGEPGSKKCQSPSHKGQKHRR